MSRSLSHHTDPLHHTKSWISNRHEARLTSRIIEHFLARHLIDLNTTRVHHGGRPPTIILHHLSRDLLDGLSMYLLLVRVDINPTRYSTQKTPSARECSHGGARDTYGLRLKFCLAHGRMSGSCNLVPLTSNTTVPFQTSFIVAALPMSVLPVSVLPVSVPPVSALPCWARVRDIFMNLFSCFGVLRECNIECSL